jgi:hypothetical protein
VQVPTWAKLTTPAVIEHTADDEASMVMATVRPEGRWPSGCRWAAHRGHWSAVEVVR